tara:strand:+ start:637 stop:1278 length:642 start_codon:yes stop_codon:yes gene_type:complete
MKGFGGFGNSPVKQRAQLIDNPDKSKVKKKATQQGPQQKANIDLQKGEMEGTWVYKGDKKFDRKAKAYKFPTTQNKAERITDYEDRAEFVREDALSSEGKKKQMLLKTAKNLQREADIIRDRKPAKKSPIKQTKFPNSTKAKKVRNEKRLAKMDAEYAKGLPARISVDNPEHKGGSDAAWERMQNDHDVDDKGIPQTGAKEYYIKTGTKPKKK